jgi:UDP-N-acetylmuramoylalanine--D-glutamate ligase
LGREQDYHALLDRGIGDGAVRTDDAEAEVSEVKFEGITAAVAGLGKSGLAAVSLLAQHGAKVRAIDSRTLAEIPGAAEQLTAAGAVYAPQSRQAFAGVDLIVLSPGVPVDLPELRGVTAPVIGEVELAS